MKLEFEEIEGTICIMSTESVDLTSVSVEEKALFDQHVQSITKQLEVFAFKNKERVQVQFGDETPQKIIRKLAGFFQKQGWLVRLDPFGNVICLTIDKANKEPDESLYAEGFFNKEEEKVPLFAASALAILYAHQILNLNENWNDFHLEEEECPNIMVITNKVSQLSEYDWALMEPGYGYAPCGAYQYISKSEIGQSQEQLESTWQSRHIRVEYNDGTHRGFLEDCTIVLIFDGIFDQNILDRIQPHMKKFGEEARVFRIGC